MWRLRNIKEKIEHSIFKFSDIEIKVREITGDQPWPPSGSEMDELATISYEYDCVADLMSCLWNRLKTPTASWCNVYKTLLIIDYLVKHGSDMVLADVKNHIYLFNSLKSRPFEDDNGKDKSRDIVYRSDEIIRLIDDSQRLDEERRRAKVARENTNQYSSVKSHFAQIREKTEEDNSFQSSAIKMFNSIRRVASGDDHVQPSFNRNPTPQRTSYDSGLTNQTNQTRGIRLNATIRATSYTMDETTRPTQSETFGNFSKFESAPPKKEDILVDLMSFNETFTQPAPTSTDIFDPFATPATEPQAFKTPVNDMNFGFNQSLPQSNSFIPNFNTPNTSNNLFQSQPQTHPQPQPYPQFNASQSNNPNSRSLFDKVPQNTFQFGNTSNFNNQIFTNERPSQPPKEYDPFASLTDFK